MLTVIKSKDFKDVTNKQHFDGIYCSVDVVKYNFSAQPSFYWTLPMTGTLSTFTLFLDFKCPRSTDIDNTLRWQNKPASVAHVQPPQ